MRAHVEGWLDASLTATVDRGPLASHPFVTLARQVPYVAWCAVHEAPSGASLADLYASFVTEHALHP